ncbi:hypothetical protein BOX15_Mlig009940g3, partial [Macrostomum lignano]
LPAFGYPPIAGYQPMPGRLGQQLLHHQHHLHHSMLAQQPGAVGVQTAAQSAMVSGTGEIDKKGEPYCKAVYAVAERYLKHMSPEQREDMRKLFNSWKNAPDKLDVSFMYKLSGWRAVYTLNLFRSRIQTVWFSLKQLLSSQSGIGPQLAEILNRTQRIVSIGCGPGPCIASILIALRDYVGFTKYVKLIGIDQFIGWGPYVTSMNSVEEAGASSVEFWHERVEEATIDSLPNADVAIMSYTDAAIHTPKFWETMRMKFAFILVLDQRKGALSRELQRQGFGHFEYEFKGSKRVFYYINPFGEFLKLAHGAGGGGARGTFDGAGGLRAGGADDDDDDNDSSVFDDDSSLSTSSSCSGSSYSSDEEEDNAASAALEDSQTVAREVEQVVTFLLDKTEESLLLGRDESIRPHAVTPEEIALAAAVVRQAEAHDRTIDKRRVVENTIDVSLELEAIITKELVAAVESMNASAAAAENSKSSSSSTKSKKQHRQSRRSRQSKTMLATTMELDEDELPTLNDANSSNDATIVDKKSSTQQSAPTSSTPGRPAAPAPVFVSVPISQIAELEQVRRIEQELGLPSVPKRKVENLNLSRNRHRAQLNKTQQDQLVKALLRDMGEDPDEAAAGQGSGSSSSSDDEEEEENENVNELCDADIEEKYFPKLDNSAAGSGAKAASSAAAATISTTTAVSVSQPTQSKPTPAPTPMNKVGVSAAATAGGGSERVLSVKMPEWAQSLIHSWSGESSGHILSASRRPGAGGNKSACIINLTGGPMPPIGAVGPSRPMQNQQQQQQQWRSPAPNNNPQRQPAPLVHSPGGPISTGYQQRPVMAPPTMPPRPSLAQGYQHQGQAAEPPSQVAGYPAKPAAAAAASAPLSAAAARRMTEDERILEEETQKFLERMGVIKPSGGGGSGVGSRERDRDRDRNRDRDRDYGRGRDRDRFSRRRQLSSQRRSPPRSPPRSPSRSPSESPKQQKQQRVPRSPPRSPRSPPSSPKRRRQSSPPPPPKSSPQRQQPLAAATAATVSPVARQTSLVSVVVAADAGSGGGSVSNSSSTLKRSSRQRQASASSGSSKRQKLPKPSPESSRDQVKDKRRSAELKKERDKEKEKEKEKEKKKRHEQRQLEEKKKKKKHHQHHHHHRGSAEKDKRQSSKSVKTKDKGSANNRIDSPDLRALEDLEFVSEDSDLEQLNYAHQLAAEAAAKKQQQQVLNGTSDNKRIKSKR